MIDISKYEFWFLTGSQNLYGKDVLDKVKEHSKKIAAAFNESRLPCKIICKEPLTGTDEIVKILNEANLNNNCAGIICWMHTFSPAKIWIRGLNSLNKPILEMNTQFNTEIPYESIDMDFMNLNQSAHGDREFGFITSRMDIPRKVIVGHWLDEYFQNKISIWMKAALGYMDGKNMTIVRFGDNMRDVAVTDGDKVEAMIKFGWSVPYYGIGDLVKYINEITEEETKKLMKEYEESYNIIWGKDKEYTKNHIKEQAKIEIALKAMLKETNAKAFCTNFQDLHGLKQLPGLAVQRLMSEGYGFAGEGDWKISALVRTFKVMGEGLKGGGSSFMEDYTYNLEKNNMIILGSHMLEICPSIAEGKSRIEVHKLGIGKREDPARLVFNGKAGDSICASIVDMGNRFRMVVNEVKTIETKKDFPKLPVARVLWKPLPNLITAAEAWILAGGGHHTAYSNIIDTRYLIDYAEMTRIELLVINGETNIKGFRNEMRWNEAYWNMR